MEYRNLGRTGLQVSAVGLGCNNIGRQVDQEGANAIVNKCVEMGITLFDGADVYGSERGHGEEVLGKALKPHRRNVVLATKGSGRMGDGPYWAGASRRYLMDALDASLKRLDTDYIDLYQVHFPDPATPIDETLRALEDMVRSGRVRYAGCSNYSVAQLSEAAVVAQRSGLPMFVSAQTRFSLLERDARRDFLPLCETLGVSVLPFYPLASGLLTGKYRAGELPPSGTRLTSGIHFYAGVLENADYDTIGKLTGFANERGHSILELAIGWLASQPAIGSVITGATRVDQIEANARAGDWRLTPGEMHEIDVLLGEAV
jgi:aryl-alcohol dehydrogenase-like predicted oxidoreductase